MALHHDLIPWLKPAEMLAWMAQNPLLVEAYPSRCASRGADLAAGRLTKAEVQTISQGMTQERTRLRLALPAGRADMAKPEWERIQELLQSGQIDHQERSRVRAFASQCHASEWPWLIARMEEVITRRAKQEEHLALAA